MRRRKARVHRVGYRSALAVARRGCLRHESGDEAAALVGLRVPLHTEREAAVGRLEGLGQLVDGRPAGDLESFADAVDRLVVVGLRSVRGLAGGAGLEVTGWSSIDELPEAFEAPDRRFALGVQWHPEADEQSRLIAALVAEATAARNGSR